MKQERRYKSINVKPAAFEQLEVLATLLSNEYAKVNLGTLVAQLIDEKLTQVQELQK